MRTKCYSVKLESLISISDKAYKAFCFDGKADILPKSCVYGEDMDVQDSNVYWIAASILPKKNIQWSNKKVGWFDEKGNRLPNYYIKRHIPDKHIPVDNIINNLKK